MKSVLIRSSNLSHLIIESLDTYEPLPISLTPHNNLIGCCNLTNNINTLEFLKPMENMYKKKKGSVYFGVDFLNFYILNFLY